MLSKSKLSIVLLATVGISRFFGADLAKGHLDYSDETLTTMEFPAAGFSKLSVGSGGLARMADQTALPSIVQLPMRGVKKQHGVGSCTACSITSALESILQEDLSAAALFFRVVTEGKLDRDDRGANLFEYCGVLSQGVVRQGEFPADEVYGRYVAERRQQDPESCLASSERLTVAMPHFLSWCQQRSQRLPAKVTPQWVPAQKFVGGVLSNVLEPKGYWNPMYLNVFRVSLSGAGDPLVNIKALLTKVPVVISLPVLDQRMWEGVSAATGYTLMIPNRMPYDGADRYTDALREIRVFPDYLLDNDATVLRQQLEKLKRKGRLTSEAYEELKEGIEQRIQANGSHAVCVYGYDDAKGMFFAQNSWGANWGDQGRFKIEYKQVRDFARNVMVVIPSQDTRVDRNNRTDDFLTKLFNAYRVGIM